ncbi:MAG: hypothetical protein ACR2GR_04595 [Rhodothermales bacterium]
MEYRTYSLAELLPEALEHLTGRRTSEASLKDEELNRSSVPPRLPSPVSRPRPKREAPRGDDPLTSPS